MLSSIWNQICKNLKNSIHKTHGFKVLFEKDEWFDCIRVYLNNITHERDAQKILQVKSTWKHVASMYFAHLQIVRDAETTSFQGDKLDRAVYIKTETLNTSVTMHFFNKLDQSLLWSNVVNVTSIF